jgi:excisionase family DNA binding protein
LRELFSAEEVAELLGLHVKTVRAHVRSGRIKAVRVGRRYRIPRSSLAALTAEAGNPAEPAPVEVSSVVRIAGVDFSRAERFDALIQAAIAAPAGAPHVQTIHDRERATLTVVIVGTPRATAELLQVIENFAEAP